MQGFVVGSKLIHLFTVITIPRPFSQYRHKKGKSAPVLPMKQQFLNDVVKILKPYTYQSKSGMVMRRKVREFWLFLCPTPPRVCRPPHAQEVSELL